MEYTENYNLEKQQEEDFIDINGINANFDTIDTTMKEIADAVAGKAAASHNHNYAGSSTPGGAATTALACSGNAATATTAASCSGNSATATKATQDGNGKNIADTYAQKASPTFTGSPTLSADTAYTTAKFRNINVVAKANSPVNGASSNLPNGTITFVKKE